MMLDEQKIRREFEKDQKITNLGEIPAVRYNLEFIKWLISKLIEARRHDG